MDLLLTYDIDTTTTEGQRRLRQMAKLCEGYGHRVQLSVFEMVLNQSQYIQLKAKIADLITNSDHVRLYKLTGQALDEVEILGATPPTPHRNAWIL